MQLAEYITTLYERPAVGVIIADDDSFDRVATELGDCGYTRSFSWQDVLELLRKNTPTFYPIIESLPSQVRAILQAYDRGSRLLKIEDDQRNVPFFALLNPRDVKLLFVLRPGYKWENDFEQ